METEKTIKFRSDTYTYQDVLDQYNDIYWVMVREDPVNVSSINCSWIGREGGAITVTLDYDDDIETLRQMKKDTVELADEITSKLHASGLSDYEKIMEAVSRIREQSPEGVLVIPDMGSSCMTAQMVLEDLGDDGIVMVDCPFAEGAVAAIVEAEGGSDLATVKETAEEAREVQKF